MKRISTSIPGILLLLLVILSGLKIHGQSPQPNFSFKIELKPDGWYYASMKSDQSFSLASHNTTISTMQYTLVAPIGTFAPASQSGTNPVNMVAFEDKLPATNTTSGDYIWSKQRTAYNSTTEYIFFALTGSPVLNDIVAGADIPLFRFKTAACIGSIRLYRNVADASGPVDGKKNNSPNSIYTSGLGQGLNEGYKTNYGNSADCPMPDLTTSISSPPTGTPNVPFNYTVTANNIGNSPTSGPISESISIPSGLTFNSGGGNGWTCVPASGPSAGPVTIICTNPASIPVGGNSSFPVNVTPTTTGSFYSSTTVSGGGEINTSNNTAVSNTIVVAAAGTPDLTTSISSPSTGTPNVAFDYTVTANNIGNLSTTGLVSESISIPSGLTFNSGGGNGWTCVPASGPSAGPVTIICTNPASIPIGGNSSFPIHVTPTTTGSFTTTATVSGGGETNTSNDTAVSNTIVVGCGINAGVLTKN